MQHVGRGADVVLVAVGYENTFHPGGILFKVSDVGYHQVHARHVVLGEHGAHVHHYDVLAALEGGHVFAYLPKTAQGDNFQYILRRGCIRMLFCHSQPPLLIVHVYNYPKSIIPQNTGK